MDEKKALKLAPFNLDDLVRGEDGELYHLPTLLALHTAGRLASGSAGYLLLMRRPLRTSRLIA